MNIAKNFNANVDLGPVALSILQQFAEHEQLSSWQIYSMLQKMNYKMAYKNVHVRVKRLTLLRLIKETKSTNKSDTSHGAKYYRLTEEGIYQLFLKFGIALTANQLSPQTNIVELNLYNFLRYYNDSELFKSFLYPYFQRQTLLDSSYDLLRELFVYHLGYCCKQIDVWLKTRNIPVYSYIVRWNRVLDSDKDLFLSLLIDTFDLKNVSVEYARIENIDNRTIKVELFRHSVIVKIDTKRKRAVATIDEDKGKHEFRVRELETDSDFQIIGRETRSTDDRIQGRLDNIKENLHTVIYKIVVRLGKKGEQNPLKQQQDVDDEKILSKDRGFLRIVNDMYQDFTKGYQNLIVDKQLL